MGKLGELLENYHLLPKGDLEDINIIGAELNVFVEVNEQCKRKFKQIDGRFIQETQTDSEALPPDWRTAKDDAGNTYYWNTGTQETKWEHPGLWVPLQINDPDSWILTEEHTTQYLCMAESLNAKIRKALQVFQSKLNESCKQKNALIDKKEEERVAKRIATIEKINQGLKEEVQTQNAMWINDKHKNRTYKYWHRKVIYTNTTVIERFNDNKVKFAKDLISRDWGDNRIIHPKSKE